MQLITWDLVKILVGKLSHLDCIGLVHQGYLYTAAKIDHSFHLVLNHSLQVLGHTFATAATVLLNQTTVAMVQLDQTTAAIVLLVHTTAAMVLLNQSTVAIVLLDQMR